MVHDYMGAVIPSRRALLRHSQALSQWCTLCTGSRCRNNLEVETRVKVGAYTSLTCGLSQLWLFGSVQPGKLTTAMKLLTIKEQKETMFL